MKKIFSTLILVLGVLTIGSAQPMDTVKTWPSRFSLGAFITPSFSFRTLKAVDTTSGTANSISDANRDDIPALLFEGGIRANLMIGSRLRLTAAGVYSKRGYQSKRTYPGFNDEFRRYITYDYIEAPVFLSFAVAKDSNKAFYIIGGVTNGFLQKRLLNAPDYDANTGTLGFIDVEYDRMRLESEGYHMYQMGIIAGVEGNFRIAENISLFVNPNFKYNLTPTSGREQGIGRNIEEKLFSVGIAFGVDFHF